MNTTSSRQQIPNLIVKQMNRGLTFHHLKKSQLKYTSIIHMCSTVPTMGKYTFISKRILQAMYRESQKGSIPLANVITEVEYPHYLHRIRCRSNICITHRTRACQTYNIITTIKTVNALSL